MILQNGSFYDIIFRHFKFGNRMNGICRVIDTKEVLSAVFFTLKEVAKDERQ